MLICYQTIAQIIHKSITWGDEVVILEFGIFSRPHAVGDPRSYAPRGNVYLAQIHTVKSLVLTMAGIHSHAGAWERGARARRTLRGC